MQVARFLLYDQIKAGTILMKQGAKGDHMYIILSGQANIHIANTTSFKTVVHTIQHTRLLARLAAGTAASKALAEAGQNADGLESQGSLAKQLSTASLSRSPSSAELQRTPSQQAMGKPEVVANLLPAKGLHIILLLSHQS